MSLNVAKKGVEVGENCTGVLSVEEAQRLLQLPTNLPPHLVAILGKPLIDKLYGVLGNEECVAIDMLALTDELGVDAGMQYMVHVDEFRLIHQEVDSIAEKIVAAITAKNRFKDNFERSFRKVTKNGRVALEVVLENGIAKLFSVVPELCITVQPKGKASFRGGLLLRILMRAQQLLFVEFRKQFPDLVKGSCYKDAISGDKQIEESFEVFAGALKSLIYGTTGKEGYERSPVDFFLKSEEALKHWNGQNRDEIAELVESLMAEGDENSIKTVQDLTKQTAEEILELSKTKRIKITHLKLGEFIFQLLPFPNYADVVCQVVICREENRRDSDLLAFTLDRGSMEFLIGQNIIKLGDFLPIEQATLIKSLAMQVVKKAVQETPEFYEDYLIAEPKPAEISVVVSAEVGEVLNEVAESMVGVANAAAGEANSSDFGEENQTGAQKLSLQKLYPKIDFTRFKNIPGKRVLAILNSIFSEVKRVNGSHHIFENKSGVSLSVPVHGNEVVSPALLVNNLRKWGILEEFYQKL